MSSIRDVHVQYVNAIIIHIHVRYVLFSHHVSQDSQGVVVLVAVVLAAVVVLVVVLVAVLVAVVLAAVVVLVVVLVGHLFLYIKDKDAWLHIYVQ